MQYMRAILANLGGYCGQQAKESLPLTYLSVKSSEACATLILISNKPRRPKSRNTIHVKKITFPLIPSIVLAINLVDRINMVTVTCVTGG